MRTILLFLFTLQSLAVSTYSQASAEIRIEKGDLIPMTLLPMTGTTGSKVQPILENDLALTSAFEMVQAGAGGFEVSATVSPDSLQGILKTPQGKIVFTNSFTGDARSMAHQFADAIVEALTGIKGIATSKVAFISKQSGQKEVYMMDIDGHNLVQVTNDKSIALGPRFSYDNSKIAFTSYKSGFPDVWVIDLKQMKKTRIAYFPGANTSPAISPDGSTLALTLSKAGNTELYTMPAGGGDPTRLTKTRGTEATPTWSPDGRELIFVSDDRGSPQLFRIPASGGQAARLKTYASYSTEPDWSPDGKKLAYSIMEAGQSQIWMMNLGNTERTNLTTGGIAESPSWTRNSRHLIYAQSGRLYLLDSSSGRQVQLKTGISSCTQPTCSR
ncbi:MAG: LpqB family beta-propeller domain-containing protein [Verrucomicrobiota bacterium]